jgi:hypothetical protein
VEEEADKASKCWHWEAASRASPSASLPRIHPSISPYGPFKVHLPHLRGVHAWCREEEGRVGEEERSGSEYVMTTGRQTLFS